MNREFVYVSDSAKGWIVRPSQIVMLEPSGNYTRISLANGKAVMIRRPLHKCEAELDGRDFFRTSRQCVVNLGCVTEIEIVDAKRVMFRLTNGKEISLSRVQTLLLRRNYCL